MDALQQLEGAIQELELDELSKLVLKQIAVDPHGLELAAAPSVIASLTNRSLADCSIAITNLASSQFIIKITVGNGARDRLVANFERLGLGEEIKQALLIRALSFETLGAPHSPKAMATLDKLFEEKNTIYIAVEVTSHRVFKKLKDRAESQLSTTFLMPKKRDLPAEIHSHYKEVLDEWIEFIKKGDADLMKFIRIRLTHLPYKHLYTSSISSSHVRFDLYQLFPDEHTTRRGDMVEAQKDTSLYEMVYREYCQAMYYYLPLFRLWPLQYIGCYGLKYSVALVGILIAIGLTWHGGLYVNILAAVATGIAVDSLYDILRARRWEPPSLYTR